MIESPTANFTGSEQALFSPEEIRALMRAEVERAGRYGHPLACLAVEVDRLENLTDLYGHESREEVLAAVVELMLARLRVGDFLGSREGDRFILLLPFTPPQGARVLAERLLEGARQLAFDCDGRTVRVGLAIGASYAARGATYEELRRAAELGAAQGCKAGGRRFVEWCEPPPEKSDAVAALRAELEERMRLLRESLAVPDPRPAEVPAELSLADKLRELLASPAAPAADGQREADLQDRIQELIAQHNRQIDVLERRIGKLTVSLEATEEELRRMALLREIDPGLASRFKSVQGLDSRESMLEAKKEMMSAIFKANVELHDEIARRAGSN